MFSVTGRKVGQIWGATLPATKVRGEFEIAIMRSQHDELTALIRVGTTGPNVTLPLSADAVGALMSALK